MKYSVILLLGAMAWTSTANAEFYPINKWQSIKQNLADKGATIETVYAHEFWRNMEGGTKEGSTFLSNLDAILGLDTEKLGWWENGRFNASLVHNNGDEKLSSQIVGDFQAASNIEAPRSTRLYELYYDHLFMDDQFSLLIGQQDYNNEFAFSEVGAIFINSSFGIPPVISLNARPPVFPVTAPGVRAKWQPASSPWHFQLGAYDGNPGDAEINKHNTRWILSKDQGAFITGEVHYRTAWALPGTYKLGAWHNTGDFADLVDTDSNGDPVIKEGNEGGYVILDQAIYREAPEEKENAQGLNAFFVFGGAPDHLNEIDYSYMGGLNYQGLFPGRNNDQLGVGMTHASISNDLTALGGRDDYEQSLELTYRAVICDYFVVQPDIQWIFNPGADPALEDATVLGLRVEVAI